MFAHLLPLAAGQFTLRVSHDAMISIVVAISAGLFLIILARQINLPAIVLLLLGGIALGPEGIGIVQPASLGSLLSVIVALSVGLILFEGGLTLDLRGYTSGSQVITRLLSIGVLVTWLGTALCVALVFGVSPELSLLAGSLVIVTGPTVIAPLLKRIKVRPNLHHILHWEGVMIDPIGVFIALLCYEWIVSNDGGLVLGNFALRSFAGILIGILGGWIIVQAFRRRWIPRNLTNAFALAAAVAVFGIAEAVISEAGLLSVTVAGFVVGLLQPAELRQIRQFKAEITDLLIGLLFILLAARLQFEQFAAAGTAGVLVVALIVLVVRPLNILASTWGTGLSWREKVFLSWVAPRGIVAASMASLFALGLSGEGSPIENPQLVETLTYSVIVATVILQGFSAGWVARLLGLQRPTPTGWLLIGANPLARRIARFLRDEAHRDVLLIDTNSRLVAEARQSGLNALCDDARNVELTEAHPELLQVGHLLALTDNTELNELLCLRWSDALDIHESAYRWSGARQLTTTDRDHARQIAFPGLARPTVISSELRDGEARLWTVTADKNPLPGLPLLILRRDRILPVTALANSDAVQPGDRVLLIERDAGFLARSLELGAAIDLHPTNLPSLYEQLLDTAVARNPAISREESLRDLSRPEKLLPTVIGHGIAVPHLFSRHTTQRLCVFARLPNGLALPEFPEPIRIVFFLISPAGDPDGHLATLAEVARFCADPAHRDRIQSLPTIAEVHQYLRIRSH